MDPVFYERRSETIFTGPICDHPYPAHVHEVLEIVCLMHGRMEMTIDGQRLCLKPGDVAVTFPHVPHSYDVVSEDASGLTLIFLPDAIGEFSHTFRTMLPVSPLVHLRSADPMLRAIVLKMSRFTPEESARLTLGYLHLFLSYLLSTVTLRPAEKSAYTGLCRQALDYVSRNFAQPLTLETVARALGVSRIHLSHIFSQQLHINFRQYINTLRIDKACSLLLDPTLSISEIVYQCGYGNPRTFHRAFQAQMGMPPSQYRARLTAPGLPESDEVPSP